MSQLNSGLEAIDHQGKSALAKELESAITELQKMKEVGMLDLDKFNINKIIKHHTGMLVKVIVGRGLSAFASFEPVTKNNVFVESWNRNYFEDRETNRQIIDHGRVSGTLDLKNGKVGGDFSKIYAQITMGVDFLAKGSPFTPGEVAGILIHEIGHLFTNLEMAARFTRTNLVLEAGMRKILECETKEQRIQILSNMENIFGEKIDDMERIAEVKKHKDFYRTVFLTLAARESVNQLGFNLYDMRACEQAADQFASRHGMGRDLATALDKLHRWSGDRVYWNTFIHSVIWVFELLTFIPATIIYFGLPILIMSSLNYNSYDPIPQRIEKFKHDIQSALKDRDIPKEERQRLLADLGIIDNVLSEMKDNESFYSFLWNKVIPFGRTQRKEIVFNEQLERMMNNSLFGAAAALKA